MLSAMPNATAEVNSTPTFPLTVDGQRIRPNESVPIQSNQLLLLMPPMKNIRLVGQPRLAINPIRPVTFVAHSPPNNIQSTVLPNDNTTLIKGMPQVQPISLITNPLVTSTTQVSHKICTVPINMTRFPEGGSSLNYGINNQFQNGSPISIINWTTGNTVQKTVGRSQQKATTVNIPPAVNPRVATDSMTTNTALPKAPQAALTASFPPGYKNPFDYSALKKGYVPNLSTNDTNAKEIKSDTNAKEIKSVSPRKWTCTICFEVKKDKESLLDHYEFHKKEKENSEVKNINENDIVCQICLEHFDSAIEYKNHASRLHGERVWSCHICNMRFSSTYSLSLHYSTKHSDNTETLTCCVCKVFTCEKTELLKNHINEIHKENKLYKCYKCYKTFSSLNWLNEHKLFHAKSIKLACNICKESFSHSRCLVAHNKKRHTKPSTTLIKYQCDNCSLNFADKKTLLKHRRSHLNDGSLCFICGKVFNDSASLSTHLKIHSGVKNHTCNVCGKSFLRSNTLLSHLRTHNGEKPYKCKTCGKCFSQRSPLVIHQRLHTGDRPYVCSICSKGYVSKSALNIHRMTCKA